MAVRQLRRRIGQAGFGDMGVQHVVAQVLAHDDAFQARFRFDDLAGLRVGHDVQRQHGHFAARVQRKRLDDAVGLHRDLVARHVDRGQARAGQLVELAVAGDGQARRGHVDADAQAAVGQGGDGQRVVDFGGRDVIHRVDLGVRQRQFAVDGRQFQVGEGQPSREVHRQEAALVQRQRMRPGAQFEQQTVGAFAQLGAGGVQRLPLLRILVRTDQERLGGLGDGFGQAAGGHVVDPFLLLFGLALLLVQGGQRGGQDVRRGGTVAALAAAVEVRRRAVQAHQQRGLFDGRGGVSEVVGGQGGRVEFFLGRAFPQELQVQRFGGGGRLAHQRGRFGRGEVEQGIGALDLAALARVRLHLKAGVGLGQDVAGLEAAVVFVKHIHGGDRPGRRARAALRSYIES
ncbi:hypothetical protein D3C85_717060 [compost metagenome]